MVKFGEPLMLFAVGVFFTRKMTLGDVGVFVGGADRFKKLF